MGGIVEAIGDAVGDVVDFVGDAVGDVVEFVADNPLILAAAVPFLPGIGAAAGLGAEAAVGAMSVPGAFGAMSTTASLMTPSLSLGALGGTAAGLTAAEMLAAEGAADIGMGFGLADVNMGLEGIGGLEGLGLAGDGLTAGLAEGLSGGLQSLSGLDTPSWMSGIDDLGQLGYASDASIGSGLEGALVGAGETMSSTAAPSAFESAISGSPNYMQGFGGMSMDPALSAQSSLQLSSFDPYLYSQAPVQVASSLPTSVVGNATQSGLSMIGEDLMSNPLATIKRAGGDVMNFLEAAGKTPTAQGVKTLGNAANAVSGVQNIYNNYQTAQQQKQMMDAQLEAYRTAGQQTGSKQSAAPNQAFGYRNYAGQFGIGV